MEGLVSPLDERMDQEHARVRQIYAAVRVATQGESIAGYLYDRTSDYSEVYSFFLYAFAAAAGALFFLRIPAVEPGREAEVLRRDRDRGE